MATVNFNKLLANKFKCGVLFIFFSITTLSSFAENKAPAYAVPTMVPEVRPVNIPKDYVVTPFGYFHPSCVQAVQDHASILADGSIKSVDGSVQPSSACKFSRYAANGESIQANSQPMTIKSQMTAAAVAPLNGWIQRSQLRTKSAFGGMSASWIVPLAPSYHSRQVIYFFPGLEEYGNVRSILQPVLGWNAFNDSAWSIASWNCCANGVANYSAPKRVAARDKIYGEISNNCVKGTITCPSWNITTKNERTQESTTLSRTSNYGQTFNWAFGGVLEVYGVYYCQNYPAERVIHFTDIKLLDANKVKISDPSLLAWKNEILHYGNCNYWVGSTANATTMTY